MIKKKLIFALMGVFAIIGITISISYAWFTSGNQFDSPEVSGYSKAAYFAGGDGSKDNPYIIANKRHLYNLAWLQYLGKFNQEVGSDDENTSYVDESQYMKTYYFKLNNDIDCGDMYMPPIGTTKYPFIGNFNGNGKVISNFKTTNIYNDITMKPSSVVELEDCSIVGLFGVVGPYEGMTNETGKTPLVKATYTDANSMVTTYEINAIHDFYINEADIYSHGETLVGIIAGYANGFMKNIGVHYADISLASGSTSLGSYSSISGYSLVGEYNEDEYAWSDMPGEGGVGYGASIDLKGLFEALGGTDETDASTGIPIGTKQSFPIIKTSNTIIADSELGTTNAYKPDGSNNSDIQYADTQAASIDNIGYFTGNDIKLYNKPGKIDYTKFYVHNTSDYSTELTGDDLPEQKIIEYLQEYGSYMMWLSHESQLAYNGASHYYVVKDGIIGGKTTDILVPRYCVLVAPKAAGTFKFVVVGGSSAKSGFRVSKVKRNIPGDYTSGLSLVTTVLECNSQILPGLAYYYEVDVTAEDIAAGYEFTINAGDGGTTSGYKPYIAYIDVGATGGTATQTPVNLLSGIDFVKISNATSSGFEDMLADSYAKSNLLFAINLGDGSASAVVGVAYYYRRKDITGDEDYTDVVLYFDESSSSTTGLAFKTLGTGVAVKASDRTCQYREGTITAAQIAANTVDAYNALDNATAAYTADYYSKITALNNLLTSFKSLSDSDLADTAWSSSTIAAKTAEIEDLIADATDAYNTKGAEQIEALIAQIPDNAKTENQDISSNLSSVESAVASVESALATAPDAVKNKISSSAMTSYNNAVNNIEACYSTVTVIVTGSTVGTIEVINGNTITTADLTNLGVVFESENYTITGWKDSNGNTFTLGTTAITSDLTLTAVVTGRFTVTFDANGGVYNGVTSVTVDSGNTVDEPAEPTKEGTEFLGWYDTNGNLFDFSTEISSNVSLTARYRYNSTVTIEVNGGTFDGTATINESTGLLEITGDEPTLENKFFGGWYLDSSFTNKINTTDPVTSNITIYAKWNDTDSVSITFDFSSASGFTPAVSSVVVEAGDDGKVIFPTYYDGYYFASDSAIDAYEANYVIIGWKDTSTDTTYIGDVITIDNKKRIQSTSTFTESMTLQAVWASYPLTAYFDFFGSGQNVDTSSLYYVAQVESKSTWNLGFAYPPIDPTKLGYTFTHWVDAWDGTRTQLDDYSQSEGNAYFHAVFAENITSSLIVHDFVFGTTSSFFTITNGNMQGSPSTITYDGTTYSKALKLESSTNIAFTLTNAMTLTLVLDGADGKKVKVDEESYEVASNIVTLQLEAGSHTITKGDQMNLYAIILKA